MINTITSVEQIIKLLCSIHLLSPSLVRSVNPQTYTLRCSQCKLIGAVTTVGGTVGGVTAASSFWLSAVSAAEAASCVALSTAFPPSAPAFLSLAAEFSSISAGSLVAGIGASVGSAVNTGIAVANCFTDCPFVKKAIILENKLERIELKNRSLKVKKENLKKEIENLKNKAKGGEDRTFLKRRIRELEQEVEELKNEASNSD